MVGIDVDRLPMRRRGVLAIGSAVMLAIGAAGVWAADDPAIESCASAVRALQVRRIDSLRRGSDGDAPDVSDADQLCSDAVRRTEPGREADSSASLAVLHGSLSILSHVALSVESVEVAERASTAARDLGAALDLPPERRAEDLENLARIRKAQGDPEAEEDLQRQALPLVEEALVRAEEGGDLAAIDLRCAHVANLYFGLGDYRRASKVLLRRMEVLDARDKALDVSQDPAEEVQKQRDLNGISRRVSDIMLRQVRHCLRDRGPHGERPPDCRVRDTTR